MLPNTVPAIAKGGGEEDGGGAGLVTGGVDAGRVFVGTNEGARLPGRVLSPPVVIVVYRKTLSVTRSVSHMKRE